MVYQARLLLYERNLNELVDPRLGSTYNVSQMQAMISAAALCGQKSSQQRPKISEVLKMLDEFSDKSDVYSFGVILLELITGRTVIDGTRPQGEEYIIAWARPLLDERNLNELVDPRLSSTYNVSQMQAMISAAALCVQESSQQRPKISEVLKMLDEFSHTEED
jgi:tellurite resistance protein